MPNPPELRKLLEDALIEHTFVQGDDEQPGGCTGASCTWHGWFLGDWRRHVAEVLLSLPGIAIVQLPQPDPDTGPYFDAGCGAIAHVSEGDVRLHSLAWKSGAQGGIYRSPAMARVLAAALLAAAAEADHA